MVEAGGIEPPSADHSRKGTTDLVHVLFVAPASMNKITKQHSPRIDLSSASGENPRFRDGLLTPLQITHQEVKRRELLIKLQKRNCR